MALVHDIQTLSHQCTNINGMMFDTKESTYLKFPLMISSQYKEATHLIAMIWLSILTIQNQLKPNCVRNRIYHTSSHK